MADNRPSKLPPLQVKAKPITAKRKAKAMIAATKTHGPQRRFAPITRGKPEMADAC